MMEVSREMKGSRDKCFSILVESLLADIKDSTNEEVKIEDVKVGYTYYRQMKSRMGNEGKVKVEISKLDVPSNYEAVFTSSQGVNTLSYLLEDIDQDKFRLTYNEDFVSEKGANNLNFKIMSKLFSRSSSKRIKLTLDKLQSMLDAE